MKKPLRIVTNSSRFVYGSRIVVWRERQTPLWLVVWARDLQSCINFIVKVWTGKGVMSYHVIFVQPINPNRGSKCLFEMTQSLDDHRTVCSCASICCRSVFVSISRYCKNSWTTNLCQTMLPQMCMMNSNEFKIDDIWIEWIEFDFHQHSTGLWYSYLPTRSILDVTGDSWHLRYQVALVPGIAFGNPKCLRLSYAATKENITETRQDTALKKAYLRGFGSSMLYVPHW